MPFAAAPVELAQVSEQYFRAANSGRLSHRPVGRWLRKNSTPQRAQNFGGSGRRDLGMSGYPFFRFGMEIGAHSSHSGGKPINHATKVGANAPGFSVGSDCEFGTMPSG